MSKAQALNVPETITGVEEQFLHGRELYISKVIQPALKDVLRIKGVPMGEVKLQVMHSWHQDGKANQKPSAENQRGYRPANFWYAVVNGEDRVCVSISPYEVDPEQAFIHALDATLHGISGEVKYQGAWRELAFHCGLSPMGKAQGSKAWSSPGINPLHVSVRRTVDFYIHGLSRGRGEFGLPDDGLPAGAEHHEPMHWETREDQPDARAHIKGGKSNKIPVFACPFWNEKKGAEANCNMHTFRLPKHLSHTEGGKGEPKEYLTDVPEIGPCSVHDGVFKGEDGKPKRAFLKNMSLGEEVATGELHELTPSQLEETVRDYSRAKAIAFNGKDEAAA